MKSIVIIFSILMIIGCSDATLEQELADTKAKLAKAETALAEESDEIENPLVHIVYFKLKPDADQEQLIKEIEKVRIIEVLHNLEIGTFEDLGDDRALSDYQLMMSMEFKNEEDYKTYQAHELHLALKKAVGSYLAGPPATYDYIEK